MQKKKRIKSDKDSNDSRFSLGLSQETKNGIWGVASFGVALIAILAYVGKAGAGGDLFYAISVKLLGQWGLFLVPLSLAMLGAAFLKDIHRKIYTSALLGTLLFILAFLGIFFIMRDGDFDTRLLQGGYLGVILGYHWTRYSGNPYMARVSIFAYAVASLLLLLGMFGSIPV